MNADAAQELLDLIMLDDFVQRRGMLGKWSKRWLATLHVEYESDVVYDPRAVDFAKKKLLLEIYKGLTLDETGVLGWAKQGDKIICELNCVMRRPRDGGTGG